MIMFDTSLGPYCHDQTQLSIVSFKGLRMIGTWEHKSFKDTLFIMLPRSTITRYQQNNGLRHIPRMLKFLHYQLVCLS